MVKTDYKRLYEQTKWMLDKYQDELVPRLYKTIEELQAKMEEVEENKTVIKMADGVIAITIPYAFINFDSEG